MNTESHVAGQGTILVVDDDNSFRRALRVTLSGMGFTIIDVPRADEALSLIELTRFDAILLDMDIPGMGGVEACRNIRSTAARLPILMLSALDGEEDKVLALNAGADDYITKPFGLKELTARLRAAVRRGNTPEVHQDAPIRLGDLELDPAKHRVRKSGRLIHLTPKEFELLRFFMTHAGELISPTKLLRSVWGTEYGNESVYIRMFVSQLRRKIEDDPLNPTYLVTVPRFGYRFNEQPIQN
ncbi:MAG: response regulator transcription factor [Terracidiphilus sp.]